MSKTQILIVEDELAIRDMIKLAFSSTDFIVQEADTVEQAKKQVQTSMPSLILLDWMLPGQSGISFVRWLKQKTPFCNIPIIMLTAKAEEESRVTGLETGADDYITKPFSPRELVARIKSVLRRGVLVNADNQIHVGALSLDNHLHQVSVNDNLLDLTKNEYDLLHFFMTHPNRTYSRDQLISFVWGITTYIDERTVDAQIRRLRDKLKPHNLHTLINTVRGVGYQFRREDIA